jgi:Fis family transcriptional regulator, factor for inversion stimulation protein
MPSRTRQAGVASESELCDARDHGVIFLERGNVKDQLEGLVSQMVERGILFDEAVGEFEKRFIKRVLERVDGNQSRAAHVLGIHRNTLSRKLMEYKLEHRRLGAR